MEVNRFLKTFIIAIICIFSFIGVVKAENLSLQLGYSTKLLEENGDHIGVTCSATSGNIDASPFKLNYVESGARNNFGSYYEVLYETEPTSDGTVIITCSYKTRDDVAKTQDYTLIYNVSDEMTGVTTFSLDNTNRTSYNLFYEKGMFSFTSIDLDNSDGILEIDCSTNKCVISVNSGYGQIPSKTLTGTIKYVTKKNGNEIKHTDTLIIVVSGSGARMNTSGPGTCETPSSSDWTSKGGNLYESNKLGSISVPDCTPKNTYPLLTFAGWVPIKNGESSSYQAGQTINTCATNGRTPAKGSIDVSGAGYTYFPCYVRSNGIIINGNGNKILFPDNQKDKWIQFGAAGSYYNNKETNIVLPNVELTGYFSENKSIKGWYNQDKGTYHQPGDTVTADGSTYILEVETTVIHRNYYKSIYVNEPYLLKPSEAEVTECRSANTEVISTSGSGECILYGNKVSSDYIDVVVYGKNGYQKTFYVSVVSRKDRSESGDEPFIINIDPNVVASVTDIGTLNSYIVDSCDNFSLAGYRDTGVKDGGGSNILGYKFNKSGCNSNINYNSYCIDAGRLGPTAGGMSYIKSETINMNSDFGKLVTYMGRQNMYTDSDSDITDVTTCIRIVGIMDGISVASDFNINEKQHAASYESYAVLAERLKPYASRYHSSEEDKAAYNNEVNTIYTEGKINSRVKDILLNYKGVEDTKAAGFERQIEDIDYSEIADDGSYTVTFTGVMYVPGAIKSIENPISSQLEVLEREITENEELSDSERTAYNFKIAIRANVKTLTLPETSGKSTIPVLELSKDYCFKVTISDSKGMDAFMMEPGNSADAAAGYQRMLTVNSSDLSIYVYFPPSPSVNSCGLVSGLNWNDASTFNPNLFRTTGCCNLPAVPQDVLDNHCSNACISTTLTSICDYRTPELFNNNPETADLYMVNEGRTRDGDYKIGSGTNSECIVKTDDMGWASPGMGLDTSVNKTDDAGNSLMVNTYRNNLYCRVSCSENWQLSMQSFGNFVGNKAIAAGSYFQINDQDMFISGKRTCYTTFIDYGSIDGRGSGGFTNDVNIESDKIVNNYNKYSNLSHVYADLACQNDKEYSTVGGHTAVCSYSQILTSARKFCYSYTQESYCLTARDYFDWESGGNCMFKDVSRLTEYYCDEGDGDPYEIEEDYDSIMMCRHESAPTQHAATCDTGRYSDDGYSRCLSKTDYKSKVDGSCPSGYYTYKLSTGTSSTLCYLNIGYTPHDPTCDDGTGSLNLDKTKCIKTYVAHEWWTCSLGRDNEQGVTLYGDIAITPSYAFTNDLRRYGLHRESEISDAVANIGSIGVTLTAVRGLGESTDTALSEEDHSRMHYCVYSYPKLTYNKCESEGYGICINYYMSTSNGIDDGDTTPEGAGTAPGQYVNYTDITSDNYGNTVEKPKGELQSYESVRSSAYGSGSGFTTGTQDRAALDGYAYENWKQASVELADDSGSESSNYKSSRAVDSSIYDKYRIATDPSAFCPGGSWTTVASEGMSYSSGGPDIADKESLVESGNNVIITGVTVSESCDSSFPNCVTKQNSGGSSTGAYVSGNFKPSRFNDLSVSEDNGDPDNPTGTPTQDTIQDAADTSLTAGREVDESAESQTSASACGGADNCDTERGVAVREAFLDSGFKGKLDGYAQGMIAASTNINVYANDMFACQHFEMFNSTDDQNEERENNITWSTNFMGHTKSFVKIVSSFEPEVSYSYDEKEYMTILGNNNVMERFTELNDETWDKDNCYNIATRSGPGGCYNKATNQKVDTSINYYKNAQGDIESKPITLARNYTINYYYDNNNSAWDNNSIEAKSYGEQGNPGTVLELKCSNGNCNIGDQLASPTGGASGGNNKYKRAVLCTIGLVMDKPTLATYSDGKSSGTSLIYLNDKDYFWTAGTCYVNQVQYLRANYVKASIENSSFYKNKGYWYVNTANDTKANGLTLRDALTNSNNNISSTYNIDAEEELGRWSILGNYNVFPIKLTTPRDLYQYTYTFANIGSYGDGELGRVMGRDQSLIVLNTRTCFYEVFEELCMCCGNPINAHVDSESPYIFASRDEVEYEMSNEDPGDITTSTLAITTSNVSLSDITSDTDRQLGDNWSEKSTFFFNGEDSFTTRKGADLLTKLESVGDNVYSEEPEYKFTLNPEGLSHIREYNDSHTYGVTYEDLISIGRYAMNPFYDETFLECDDITNSDCRWEVAITTDDDYYPQNRIINFTHFGSNFLMNELKGIKGVTFSGKYSDYSSIGMNESCYVLQTDSVDITTELNKLSETCRWVDYVQKGTKEDGTTVDRYFRLSFK